MILRTIRYRAYLISPNYKIYNEDIYALNFKKKKKNVSSEAVKKDDGNKNNDNA